MQNVSFIFNVEAFLLTYLWPAKHILYPKNWNNTEFCRFFTQQNNDLFSTLLDVAHSHDRQLTSDHMRNMGLDPQGDRTFLMELVEHYGIDVVLMVDNPCCPKWFFFMILVVTELQGC